MSRNNKNSARLSSIGRSKGKISVTAESPIKAVKEFIRILSEKMEDGIEEIHNIEIHRVD